MQVTFPDKNAFVNDGIHNLLYDTEVNQIKAGVNSKSDQVSPALLGVPTAPTPTTSTNTNQLATTAWVHSLFNQTIVPSGSVVVDNTLLSGSNNPPKAKAVYDFFNPTVVTAQNPRGAAEMGVDDGSTGGPAGFWPSAGMFKKLLVDTDFTSVQFMAYASSDADITVYAVQSDTGFAGDLFINSSNVLASKNYPAGSFNQNALTLVTTDFNVTCTVKANSYIFLLVVKNSGTSLTTYRWFNQVSGIDPVTNPARNVILASTDGNHFTGGGAPLGTDFTLINKKVLVTRMDRVESNIAALHTQRTLYLDQFAPKADGTSDSAAFQRLWNQMAANGGGSAKVKPLPNGAYGVGRQSGPHGMFAQSNSSFSGDGMVHLQMVDNASHISALSNFDSMHVITGNTAKSDRTVPMDDVTDINPHDEGLLRMGQAAYDGGEPDYYQYCRVVAINGVAARYGAVRVQASTYSAVSGPSLESNGDQQKNLQQNLGSWAFNGYADFQVVVPTTGNYTLKFRIASLDTGATLQVLQDGSAVGTLNVPTTADWGIYTYATMTVNLTAGSRTIRILNNASGKHFNLNWFDWILTSSYVASPTVTFDKPVNYALTAGAVSRVDHKSWTRITNLIQNVVIENFFLDCTATDPANAEYGILLFACKNITIRNVTGRNTGAGLIAGQYIEGLTIENCRQLHTESQDGQGSKGRFLSLGECKDVRILNPYLEDYEADGAMVFEAKNFNVEVVNLHANNSFVKSDGSVMMRKLFVLLGETEITVRNIILEGNGHQFADQAYDYGKVRIEGNVYIADGCPCIIDENWAADFQATVRMGIQNTRYYRRKDYFEAVINIVPNMSAVIPLPSGMYLAAQAGVSDMSQVGANGFSFAALGAEGQGPNAYLVETVNNTGPITVANKSIRLGTGGFGVGLPVNQLNSVDGKYINIVTGPNINPGTKLTLKVQYLQPEIPTAYGSLVDNRMFVNTGFFDFGDTYMQRTADSTPTIYTPAILKANGVTFNGAGQGLVMKTPDGLHVYSVTINNSGQVITTLLS